MVRFSLANTKKDRRGFALLDTMAAGALLTAGIFMAVVFFRAEVREIRFTHERFAVMLLAQSEIERLHTLPYDEIELGDDQALELTLPSAERVKEISGTVSVREVAEGLKSATVQVQWRVPKGTVNRVELTRTFAREGRPQ